MTHVTVSWSGTGSRTRTSTSPPALNQTRPGVVVDLDVKRLHALQLRGLEDPRELLARGSAEAAGEYVGHCLSPATARTGASSLPRSLPRSRRSIRIGWLLPNRSRRTQGPGGRHVARNALRPTESRGLS